MYERKTIIKNLLKKYNKTYISVVENLDREKAGCVSSCNFKVYFDVVGDSILIEDIITKENISIYYEFMSDEDIEKFDKILNNNFFANRSTEVMRCLNFEKIENWNNYQFFYSKENFCIGFEAFGIKDILKPIDEYIAEIKKSEQYTALMSKK